MWQPITARLENKWFWLIPLALGAEGAPSKVSVRLVMDRDEFTASGGKHSCPSNESEEVS